MPDHFSKQFGQELESVRARVLEMGSLVEEQVRDALEGLTTAQSALLSKVIETDARVNTFEIQLDEGCQQMIARRQPAAGDMRMIFTVIKTITDLERIGDEAEKIARIGQLMFSSGDSHPAGFTEIKDMAGIALLMLRKSLDAFERLDPIVAAEVARDDLHVDEAYRATVRYLIPFMRNAPKTISTSIDIIIIAKAIERIGDHAKNISEYVVYMVKGKDIRHLSLAEAERTVLEGE